MEAISSNAMDNTRTRLSRVDKVLLIILDSGSIFGSKNTKNNWKNNTLSYKLLLIR